jgi:hypothetical protein
MIRIVIIGEGQTEQEFCKDVLVPHFADIHIAVQHPTIKKSAGGIVPWKDLKKQIELHLKQDQGCIVTTLIDFYGLKDSHRFPGWEEGKSIQSKPDRMRFLEGEMDFAIEDSLADRFLPYIQLHEFEGLLFSELEVFTNNFEAREITNLKELRDTIENYDNPEEINDGETTAPSKRLERLIVGYNKIVYGSLLAQEIGLEKIRSKCPRFDEWITKLEDFAPRP